MGLIFKMIYERGAVFIDGGYLNKVLKNYFNEADISYLKLCNIISDKCKFDRFRTYFYHCLPIVRKNNKEDLIKQSNMQRFLTNIKRLPRFEVKLADYRLLEASSSKK